MRRLVLLWCLSLCAVLAGRAQRDSVQLTIDSLIRELQQMKLKELLTQENKDY